MHYIGQNLKFYVKYKRYTYSDVAEMIGATEGMVKHYVQKRTAPQIETIIKIADMMNISIDTLIRVKLTETNYGKEMARIEDLERKVNMLMKEHKSKTK